LGSIKAVGLGKEFPGVVALDQVDMEVTQGSVHAVVGANGAGKSTLIKILSGFYPAYTGEIQLDGEPVSITTPAKAKDLGIGVVHQEVDTSVIPYLTVAENLFIDRIAASEKGTFLNWNQIYQEADKLAKFVGWNTNPRKRVEDLSLHEKQLLVIARSVSRNVRYLILDEPTASLSMPEVDRLFEIINHLKEENVGIIYVSHRLAEVKELADVLSVLRNGRKVAEFRGEIDLPKVVEAMLGAPADTAFPERTDFTPGEVVLETRQLKQGKVVRGIDLKVRKGEILVITGLVGSGKTELLQLLFGATQPDDGEIYFKGKKVHFRNPNQAVKQGIFMVPEERRKQGLLVENSVRVNITLPFLQAFSFLSLLRRRFETGYTKAMIDKVGLTPPRPEMTVANLSGGNQQKVVLAKWIGQKPQVMLFDEATQGIDVKAKRDIYDLTQIMRHEAGVVYATSEIDEAVGLADRILVIRDGQIVAEMPGEGADRQVVLEYACGARSGGEGARING
jgi:simple sugar transport system ATP-binding protein